jgi:hypothetical protein
MPFFNTVPGLVPLKIYSGNTLLTTNVNLINFTGSGVTTTVNAFNGLTVNIGGGGTTVDTGSLLKTASFSNPNLTFTKGDGSTFNVNLVTLVPTSASYALTASFATSASYALSASYASEISGGAPNYVVLWKTTSSLTSSAFYQTGSFMGLGTTTPKVKFHVKNNNFGTMGLPYETAVFETNGDTKLGVYNSNTSSFASQGASLTLGYTSITNSLGYYPGFEIQELGNTTWYENYLRFNSLHRNSSGTVLQAVQGIINVFADGRVSINPVVTGLTATSSFLIGTSTYGGFMFDSSGSSRFQTGLTVTGSLIAPTITGSLFGTASYANNALSASYAPVTPPFPYTGSAQITGSLGVTGSIVVKGTSDIAGNIFNFQNLSNTTSFNFTNYGTFQMFAAGSPGVNNATLGLRDTYYELMFGSPYIQYGRFITQNFQFGSNLDNTKFDGVQIINGAGTTSLNATSGNYRLFSIINNHQSNTAHSFNPTSGDATLTHFQVNTYINQSGTATGRIVGFDYTPSLNSITGPHYGILIRPSTLNGFGLGNTLPTASLHIRGGLTGSVLQIESNTSSSIFTITNAGTAQLSGSLGVTGSVSLRSGSNLTVNNGLIISSYNTSNTSVGGTPGWTSALRNTAIGVLTQGSVTTQQGNTSVGYLSLLGGNYNTAVGAYAAQYNTGDGNVAMGYYALGNQTSNTSYNVAIGYGAMQESSGSGNTLNIGVGNQALYNTRGAGNIGIGYRAGLTNTTGANNVFLGYDAGVYNTTGTNNVAIGYSAGNKLAGSSENILIGTGAGGTNGGGTTTMGTGNIGIGYNTLQSISSSVGFSNGNVAIGYRAGEQITTGRFNICLGWQAGLVIGSGGSNIYMGYLAGQVGASLSSNIGIGDSALTVNVSGSRNTAIGAGALANAGVAGTGEKNTAVGYSAGLLVTAGIKNVFVGNESGTSNGGNPAGSSSYNTFVGDESAIFYFPGTHCGNYNVGLGYGSFGRGEASGYITNPGDRNTGLGSSTLSKLSSSTAVRNTAVGSNSGNQISSGGNNTLVGSYSGYDLTTGNYNIFIGDSAGRSILSGSNNTIIGQFTSSLGAGTSDTIIIGAGSTERIRINSSGSMGLGTTAPSSSAKLQIDSTTQGFLPPRMTNAQRTSIVSASIGLMVYCTDVTEGLYINKSTGWTFIV